MSLARSFASGFAIALLAVSTFAAELPRSKPEALGVSSNTIAD